MSRIVSPVIYGLKELLGDSHEEEDKCSCKVEYQLIGLFSRQKNKKPILRNLHWTFKALENILISLQNISVHALDIHKEEIKLDLRGFLN